MPAAFPHPALATIPARGERGDFVVVSLRKNGVRIVGLQATQGYRTRDLGELKVAATAAAVAKIDAGIAMECVVDRYRPQRSVNEAVFCCVDSIGARAAIWKGLASRCEFWADARMRGEVIRVLAAADDGGRAAYERTLFPQAEAQAGACSAQGVIYGAAIAAGLMVHQLARWLREAPLERDVTLNLWAGEWNVA